MKLYIYSYVGGITNNWHSGGGLMVITDRDPVEVWREFATPEPKTPYTGPDDCECAEANDWYCAYCQHEDATNYSGNVDAEALAGKTPNIVLDVGDQSPERIVIFPDSGCC